MFFARHLLWTRKRYEQYPPQFWLLVGASFVDYLGGFLLFPFFALYLTARFNVGLTAVGLVFMVTIAGGVAGQMIGGVITDRFGRKKIVIISLVTSSLTNLMLIGIWNFQLAYPIGAVVGFFSGIGGPASKALLADILPKEQLVEGFGIWRVMANLAATIGPMVGGFMAGYSYTLLFVIDTVSSLITAVVLAVRLDEPMPQLEAGGRSEKDDDGGVGGRIGERNSIGYGTVVCDLPFLAFVGVSLLVTFVYVQMDNTLAVFLRDQHGIAPAMFGGLLAVNAGMVVVFQYWITRKISGRPPFLVMAVGAALYGVGFGFYGFVHGMPQFVVAMLIITLAEMLIAPVEQALVAEIAPANMRGRYMAVHGLAKSIPWAFGLVTAGLIADHLGPNWIWFFCFFLSVPASFGFLFLHRVRGAPRVGGVAE